MNDKCWVLLLLYIISECGIDHDLFVSGHLEVTEKCSRGKLNNFFTLLLQNIQQKPLEEGSGFLWLTVWRLSLSWQPREQVSGPTILHPQQEG